MLVNFVGPKFGQYVARTACLCSAYLGHQLERPNSWELKSSGEVFTHVSEKRYCCQLGPPQGHQQEQLHRVSPRGPSAMPGSLGLPHSVAAGFKHECLYLASGERTQATTGCEECQVHCICLLLVLDGFHNKILSSLKNRNLYSIILEAKSPRSSCLQIWFLPRLLSSACRWQFSACVFTRSFLCVLIPGVFFSSCKDTNHIALGLQYMNFGGHKSDHNNHTVKKHMGWEIFLWPSWGNAICHGTSLRLLQWIRGHPGRA